MTQPILTGLAILGVLWVMLIAGLFGLSRELQTQWKINKELGHPKTINPFQGFLLLLGILAISMGILLTGVVAKSLL